MKYLSFKLNAQQSDGTATAWDTGKYVYCHRQVEGDGTVCPVFTDTVKCNYRGRLIPTASYPDGYVFDQSYKGKTLDPEVNVPTSFCVGSLVVGWSTILQYMHTGDTWTIYVPYDLGYGTSANGSIPAYSTLIFNINLAGIKHPDGSSE